MAKFLLVFSLVLMSNIGFSSEALDHSEFIPQIRLTYFQNNVDVTVTNFDDYDYLCSGYVYMTLQSGRQESRYYYKQVYARSNDYQNYRTYNYNDRIINAYHNINCY